MLYFQRLGDKGHETPVAVHNDTVYDLRSLCRDIDGAFLANDGVALTRDAIGRHELPEFDATGQRIGAPIATPSAVICIGQNYAAHAAETGDAAPEHPIVFYKHPNTIVGPNDDIIMPRSARKLDWEVELAVVIGAEVRYLSSADEAPRYIAGYTISNDVSERYFQTEISGGQWSKGKSFETFNPLGPRLVPAAELPRGPQHLRLQSWVNSEARQDSSTYDMIYSVNELIYQLSQFMVLSPGDVINTGTPQGVAASGRFPFLEDGDVVRLAIELLGAQRQVVTTQDRDR